MRLILYGCLSNCKDKAESQKLKEEPIERFGPLSEAAYTTFTPCN